MGGGRQRESGREGERDRDRQTDRHRDTERGGLAGGRWYSSNGRMRTGTSLLVRVFVQGALQRCWLNDK